MAETFRDVCNIGSASLKHRRKRMSRRVGTDPINTKGFANDFHMRIDTLCQVFGAFFMDQQIIGRLY